MHTIIITFTKDEDGECINYVIRQEDGETILEDSICDADDMYWHFPDKIQELLDFD